MTQQELFARIDEKFDAVCAHVESQDIDEFVKAHTPEKWSNGQHLDHLRKTTRALNKGLAMPKLALKLKFGSKKGEENSYEDIEDRYHKLVGQATAPKSVIPDELSAEDKGRVIKWFQQEKETMKEALAKYSDKQLSGYVLPHPVLGKLSIREMTYWCIMHTEHHHALMKRDNK